MIRIANRSDVPMEQVEVHFRGQREHYGTIAPGAATEYRTAKSAYRYAFVKTVVDGKDAVLQPIDYLGESPLYGGKYTYALDYVADATDPRDRLLLECERDE